MSEELGIGKKIKKLRQEKKMTAKQLANEAGISVGMVSLLEKGSTSGSIETLRKIAKILGTTVAHLFTEDETIWSNEFDEESRYLVKKEARKMISFPDPLYKCELLVPDLQGQLEVVLIKIAAGRVTDKLLPHTKGGEECDYVLKGKVRIQLGEKEFLLKKGDCLRFDPNTPHKIENIGDKKAVIMSIITPPSF